MAYNNIEFSDKVMSTLSYTAKPEPHAVQNMISDHLSANGFNEMMCNSLSKVPIMKIALLIKIALHIL